MRNGFSSGKRAKGEPELVFNYYPEGWIFFATETLRPREFSKGATLLRAENSPLRGISSSLTRSESKSRRLTTRPSFRAKSQVGQEFFSPEKENLQDDRGRPRARVREQNQSLAE